MATSASTQLLRSELVGGFVEFLDSFKVFFLYRDNCSKFVLETSEPVKQKRRSGFPVIST